jgi:hypothetical protein
MIVEFVAGAVVLGLAFANTVALGRAIRCRLNLPCTETAVVDPVLGGTALFTGAIALGAVGLYRWPLLVGLILLPTPLAARRWREGLSSLVAWRPGWEHLVIALPLGLTIAQVLAPAVHFDLLVNYIGVARDDLLQGHLGAHPHNIHAALSLPLHVLAAFVLALGEPLNRTPFPFGVAPLWGLVVAVAVTTSLWLMDRVAAVSAEGRAARWSAMLCGAVWLTTPQTLLLAHLQSAEFLITVMALGATVMALVVRRSPTTGDTLVLGLLAGFLVAAKPQWAVLGTASLMVACWQKPRPPVRPALVGLALAPVVSAVRATIANGHPLFPWVDHGDPAAVALKAENAVALVTTPAGFVDRLTELLTLQPESGLVFAVIATGLLGRRQPRNLWILGGLPLVSLVAVTGNTVNALRWVQPALPLLLLASLIGLHHRFPSRRSTAVLRGGVGVAAIAGLLLALRFTSVLDALMPQWGMSRATYLEDRVPHFQTRTEPLPGRTLMLGEIIGYYGPAEAVFPAPQNGRWAERATTDGSVESLWIAPSGLDRLRTMPTWEWLDEGGMETLRRAARSDERRDRPGVIVCPAPARVSPRGE